MKTQKKPGTRGRNFTPEVRTFKFDKADATQLINFKEAKQLDIYKGCFNVILDCFVFQG